MENGHSELPLKDKSARGTPRDTKINGNRLDSTHRALAHQLLSGSQDSQCYPNHYHSTEWGSIHDKEHDPLEPLDCVVTDLEGARGAILALPPLLLPVQGIPSNNIFLIKLSRTAHLVTKSVSLGRSAESRHSCRVGPPPGCLIF